jgi:hypothetical protein
MPSRREFFTVPLMGTAAASGVFPPTAVAALKGKARSLTA